MNKTMIAVCGLAMLAIASIPAHANPTNKSVTVSCAFADSNTGYANVTLMDSGSGTFACPQVTCDSSMTSITVACDAPFRVSTMYADYGIMDVHSTQSTVMLKGKGVGLTFTSGGDTVSLDVK